MNNIIFELRKKALELMKSTGFSFCIEQEQLDYPRTDDDMRWTYDYDIHIKLTNSESTDIISSYVFQIDSKKSHKLRHKYCALNRAWSPYYDISFPEDDSSVFILTNLDNNKIKEFNGIQSLIKEKLKAGNYHLRIKEYGVEFLKFEDECGFTDLKQDRKALIKGVNHMKGNRKIPFEWKNLPSEQIPWIIECCGRHKEYQQWEVRFDYEKGYKALFKESDSLKKVKLL
jgi:hypothetical protein